MKLKNLILLLSLSSCAVVNPPAGPGLFHTNVKELVFYDPSVLPNSEIVTCGENIMGLFSFGDNGIANLKARAKFDKIASIERTYESVFVFYAKSCLVTKGKIIVNKDKI